MKRTAKIQLMICLVACVALLAMGGVAQATLAISFAQVSPEFSGEGNDGILFIPSVDIWVTDLLYFDYDQDGFSAGPHEVGIFDFTSEILLASTTVDSISPLDGIFRYESLPTLLPLSAGHPYMLVGFTYDGEDAQYFESSTDLTFGPEIDYLGYHFNFDSSLSFPADEDPGTAYYGGPSFRYSTVPEPSTGILVATGLVALAVQGRRNPLQPRVYLPRA